MEFITRVKNQIRKSGMIANGEKVIVGVSGGPDSMALLYALREIADEWGMELTIAHLNHGLRGVESDREEEFVKRIGEKSGIEVFSEKVDTPAYKKLHSLSTETAAREVRYRFFNKLANELAADKIALAHSKNDQAETVLMRFLRGSGTRGLGGIPPVRGGKIVRPLIEITRDDILHYLKEKKIKFLEDPSNLDQVYLRNKVRNSLIPFLTKEYNPNLLERLNVLSKINREDESYLDEVAANKVDEIKIKQGEDFIELDRNAFSALPTALKRRALREALRRVKGNLNKIGYDHIENILAIVDGIKSGRRVNLPDNMVVAAGYGVIKVVSGKSSINQNFQFEKKLNLPGETLIPKLGLKIVTELVTLNNPVEEIKTRPFEEIFDWDVCMNGVWIRNRRDGDIFSPYGMAGSKKVKHLLINKKVPRAERGRISLLVTESEILWVVGLRRSSVGPITGETRKALRVKVKFNN